MKYLKVLLAIYIMASLTILILSCNEDDRKPETVTNFISTGDKNYAPCKVAFTNTSTEEVSFAWDFGDGQTSTKQSPDHIYANGGTFSVTLTARDSDGSHKVSKKTVTIMNVPTELKINSIVLSALPRLNLCRNGWKFVVFPHLFFTFKCGQLIYPSTTEVYKDVTDANLPLTFSEGFPITISGLDFQYNIELWNSDIPTPEDRLGGFNFTPRNIMPANGDIYPTTINFTNTTSQLSLTLNIEFTQ